MFQFYRHHALWLQQSITLIPWPTLLTISWFLPLYFLSQFFFPDGTLCAFFWNNWCILLKTRFALLHSIIANFVADNFIIVYCRCGPNLFHCHWGINLSLSHYWYMENTHVSPLRWANCLVYIHLVPYLVYVFTDTTYYTHLGPSTSAPHDLRQGLGGPFRFHGICNLAYIVFSDIT